MTGIDKLFGLLHEVAEHPENTEVDVIASENLIKNSHAGMAGSPEEAGLKQADALQALEEKKKLLNGGKRNDWQKAVEKHQEDIDEEFAGQPGPDKKF